MIYPLLHLRETPLPTICIKNKILSNIVTLTDKKYIKKKLGAENVEIVLFKELVQLFRTYEVYEQLKFHE